MATVLIAGQEGWDGETSSGLEKICHRWDKRVGSNSGCRDVTQAFNKLYSYGHPFSKIHTNTD